MESSSRVREAPPPRSMVLVLALELAEEEPSGPARRVVLLRRKPEMAVPLSSEGKGRSVLKGNHFCRDPLPTASGSPAVSSWDQGLCLLGLSLTCSGKTEHMVGPQVACGLDREAPWSPDTLG